MDLLLHPPGDAQPPVTAMLGGYDAKRCQMAVHRDFSPLYTEDMKDPYDDFVQMIMEDGNVYEGYIGQLISDAIPHHVIDLTDISDVRAIRRLCDKARKGAVAVLFEGTREIDSKAAREYATHYLMEKPGTVRFLWNARFRKWKKVNRKGDLAWDRAAEPDFLCLADEVSASGKPVWLPGDVKHHIAFEGKSAPREWEFSELDNPFPGAGWAEERAGVPKKVDALQLAHYYRALEFHGHTSDNTLGAVFGKPYEDDHYALVWVDLADALYGRSKKSALDIYAEAFAQASAIAVNAAENPDGPPLARAEWHSACKVCPWRSVCHEELVEADHITLLPGVTPSRTAAHYEAGVETIGALANLDVRTAAVVDHGVEILEELIELASVSTPATPIESLVEEAFLERRWRVTVPPTKKFQSYIDAFEDASVSVAADLSDLDGPTARYTSNAGGLVRSIDRARVNDRARARKLTHVYRSRGVDTVTVPRAPREFHVDMENSQSHIYMWGVLDVHHDGNRTSSAYRPSYNFDATDEAEMATFVDFWGWFRAETAAAEKQYGPDGWVAYYYTAAENRCLRHLANKFVGHEGVPSIAEVDALIESDNWVDLYPLVTSQLVWPLEDHTLKSVAKYVRFMWRDDDPSGASSVLWYKTATEDPDPDERAQSAQRLLEYNEDDVRATDAVVEFMTRFAEVRNPGRKLPSVTELEAHYGPNRPKVRRRKAA